MRLSIDGNRRLGTRCLPRFRPFRSRYYPTSCNINMDEYQEENYKSFNDFFIRKIKDDKRKTTLRKVFPGYVLIKMILTEESWHIVRNVRGVTGFVGAGGKPVPLTDEEIREMGFEKMPVNIDYAVGDTVKIISGPLESFVGVVQEISMEKEKVRVLVSMFGRETPVELEFSQIQKM